MSKRKGLILCAVLCALVAIVGTGFSAWIFSTERRQDVNLGVKIEYATSFGDIRVDGAYRLYLDQGTAATSTNRTTDGIKLTTTSDNEAVTSMKAVWTISEASYTEATTGNNTVKYFVNLYVKNGTIGQYLTVPASFTKDNSIGASGGHDHDCGEGEAQYTGYKKEITGSAINPNGADAPEHFKNVEITFDTTNIFAFKNKPATFGDYQEMVHKIFNKPKDSVENGTAYTSSTGYSDIIIEFQVKKVTATAPAA